MTKTQNPQLTSTTRPVSDLGETLIVRDRAGVKTLTDPVNEAVTVTVPTGRRAKLVDFTFSRLIHRSRRHADVVVTQNQRRLGFAAVGIPAMHVFLQDLVEGQRVDILPSADAAAACAVLLPIMPVLQGGAAAVQLPTYVSQPSYAAVAA